MNIEQFEIAGKNTYVLTTEKASSIIYIGISSWSVDRLKYLAAYLEEAKISDVMVVAFEVADWDADLSPWQAPKPQDGEVFAGKGTDTAAWLVDQCIPVIESQYSTLYYRYIAGYSLAGLFAIWMFYEKAIFDGVICCSGSLWFEGWEQYVSGKNGLPGSTAYLSLGGKEEKTKNPVMKSIGDMTRWQSKKMEKDPNIIQHKLEWNSGGHFADAEKRLVKGIIWTVCTRFIGMK